MDSFKVAQNHVQEMVSSFKSSRFTLAVAQSMSYDQNTQFNEQNVVQYLAEIEEYISSLITFQAYRKEDPNASISSIPLENLN